MQNCFLRLSTYLRPNLLLFCVLPELFMARRRKVSAKLRPHSWWVRSVRFEAGRIACLPVPGRLGMLLEIQSPPDHFGSLRLLKRLPSTFLQTPGVFITKMLSNLRCHSMHCSVVFLAQHAQGLSLSADGVSEGALSHSSKTH